MNEEHLQRIIENYEEIEGGITLRRTRELEIHDYCKRRRVVIEERTMYLYFLTPQWSDFVVSRMEALRIRNNDNARINEHQELANNEKRLHSKLRQTEVADSAIEGIVAFDKNETPINELEDDSISPQSSSSFIDESAPRSKIVYRIYFSFTQGECSTSNLFERAVLLHRFMNRLCDTGLTAQEIAEYDLYGILSDYLIITAEGYYYLIDEAILHFTCLIYKYYKQGIREYLDSIPSDLHSLKDVVAYLRMNDTINKNEMSLRVYAYIATALIMNNGNRDSKLIFMLIPLLNKEAIEDAINEIILEPK